MINYKIKLKENVLTDFGNKEKNIEDETGKYRIQIQNLIEKIEETK